MEKSGQVVFRKDPRAPTCTYNLLLLQVIFLVVSGIFTSNRLSAQSRVYLMHDWDSGNPVVFTLGSRSDYLAAVGPVALRFASTDHTVASWAPLADLMPKKPEPPVKKPENPAPPPKPVAVAKDDSEDQSVVTKISPKKQGDDFHLNAAEVVKFFKGGGLDNASGTTPYSGVKLRFDPALPGSASTPTGSSSEAIYTQK